jgi:hypothetical protein
MTPSIAYSTMPVMKPTRWMSIVASFGIITGGSAPSQTVEA